MNFIVYKTTNLINNKFYIGVHLIGSSKNYLGSGILLKKAIKKYGKHNFKLEILALNLTKNEAYSLEKSLITVDLINSNECYNLAPGGLGGNVYDKSGSRNPMFGKVGILNPRFGQPSGVNMSGSRNPRYKAIVTKSTRDKIRTKAMLNNKDSNNPRATTIKCLITGRIWSTIKQASIDLGVNRSTLSSMINGYSPNTLGIVKESLK